MIGIVIAAHGDLAEALRNTIQGFVGETPNLTAVNLLPEWGQEEYTEALRRHAQQVDQGDGVLFVTDFYGGTPSNCVLRLISENDKWAGITGVNLTMLFEVVMNADEATSAAQLGEMAHYSAREGIQALTLVIPE